MVAIITPGNLYLIRECDGKNELARVLMCEVAALLFRGRNQDSFFAVEGSLVLLAVILAASAEPDGL